MKHEQWKVEGDDSHYWIFSGLNLIARKRKDFTDGREKAYLERACACVNACAGIENPEDLRRQRDELRAELDRAYSEIERLKAIEISYRELEKRFIDKCKVTP